jgi:hypothetical protein
MIMKKTNDDDELSSVVDEEVKSLKHYIDNTKFFHAMTDWKKLVKDAEECGEKRPPVTEYIGSCFLKIAEHLSHRPNFINYPFREDMVCDGVENCILYAHNFDVQKSTNPFSYFTQIIYYAFLRRIEKEKKQAYVKYKCLQMKDIDGKLTEWMKRESETPSYSEFLQKHFSLSENDIEKLEPKQKKRKKRKKK